MCTPVSLLLVEIRIAVLWVSDLILWVSELISLYFGCLNIYFGCVDLYFGCLNLYFGCLNLDFGCLNLYFGSLNLYFGCFFFYHFNLCHLDTLGHPLWVRSQTSQVWAALVRAIKVSPLRSAGPFYFSLFLLYIALLVLVVLRLFTGAHRVAQTRPVVRDLDRRWCYNIPSTVSDNIETSSESFELVLGTWTWETVEVVWIQRVSMILLLGPSRQACKSCVKKLSKRPVSTRHVQLFLLEHQTNTENFERSSLAWMSAWICE